MLVVLAPVSVDIIVGEFSANAALAGNSDGNYGNGKGNGGPNGGLPGKGHGKDKGPGDGDDQDGDDQDGDDQDRDDQDGDDQDNGISTTPTPAPPDGSHDGGADDAAGMADDAAGMADAEFGDAVGTVAALPTEGPVTAPVAGMPTISQLFTMGDEASVSDEIELELIANGWNTSN